MSDGKVVIDVDVNDKKAGKSIDDLSKKFDGAFQDKQGRWRKANGQFLTMKEKSEMLGKSFDEVGEKGKRGLNKIDGPASKATASIKNIAVSLGLVKIASAAFDMMKNSLDGAISRYDTLNNFPKVLSQIGFSADDSQKAIDKLAKGTQGLPTSLDDIAKSAQNIAIKTKDLDGATDTALALNNAFIASGSDAADASRGLQQYVQMLSSGKVDMQSWKTLQETMGVALNDVAEAFGFAGASAQNDLYAALQDGTITFDDFNKKIVELDSGVGGFAERARTASGGIATSFSNLKTAVVRGMTGLIEAVDKGMQKAKLGSIQDNIMKVGEAFEGALKSASTMVGPAIEIIVQAFEKLAPIFEIATNLFNDFKAVAENAFKFDELLAGVPEAFTGFGEAIGIGIENVLLFFNSFIPSIIEILLIEFPNLLNTGTEIVLNILQGIVNNLPSILEAGTEMILNLVTGILNAIPHVIAKAGEIVLKFVDFIIKNGPDIVKAGVNMLVNLVQGIVKTLPDVVKSAGQSVAKFVNGIIQRLPKILESGMRIIGELVAGLIRAIPKILSAMPKIISSIVDSFSSINWGDIGINVIHGIANGIASAGGAIADAAIGAAKNAFEGAKNFLGIHSPSRLFRDEIGFNIMRGWEIGIDKNAKLPTTAMASAIDAIQVPVLRAESISGNRGLTSSTTVLNNTTVNNSSTQSNSAVVNLLTNQNNILAKILEKDIDVYMDSDVLTGKVNKNNALAALLNKF